MMRETCEIVTIARLESVSFVYPPTPYHPPSPYSPHLQISQPHYNISNPVLSRHVTSALPISQIAGTIFLRVYIIRLTKVTLCIYVVKMRDWAISQKN